MSKEAKERCLKELKKLKQMSPMSAEATVVRNYLDWVIALPWDDKTEDRHDINEAERILEAEHYGLKKVKERILEYLAVQALVPRQRGPILCLVGPPGVGKTSLARSIAHATGRKFVRQSLGGVRDEAEIRGHRRTYIGALPGKIIQSLKKVGSQNPVFLLDEIDKMSMDFRGDPASALLEVLDPEQNNDVQRSLPRSRLRPVATSCSSRRRTSSTRSRCRCRIASRSSSSPATPSGRRSRSRKQYLIPKQAENNGVKDLASTWTDEALTDDHPSLHEGSRRAQPRARDRDGVPQDREGRGSPSGQAADATFEVTPRRAARVARRREVPRDAPREGRRDRARERPRRHDVRRRPAHRRGHDRPRQGQADADRQARRGHAGERAGRDELPALARRHVRAVERLPEQGRRPRPLPRGRDPEGRPVARASRWRPRWRARCCASRCARRSR